jgi:hypothetical protein
LFENLQKLENADTKEEIQDILFQLAQNNYEYSDDFKLSAE